MGGFKTKSPLLGEERGQEMRMTEEKWQQLIGRIKDEFEVSSHEKSGGEGARERAEEIIFIGPAGKMRLVRTIKPRALGEKTYYSGRLAAQTGIEKIYSDTETVDFVKLYREDRGEWAEMDAGALG